MHGRRFAYLQVGAVIFGFDYAICHTGPNVQFLYVKTVCTSVSDHVTSKRID